MKYFVRGLSFHPDGVVFEYAPIDGARPNGLLLNNTLFVPAEGVFADPLDDLIAVIHAALDLALGEYEQTDPLPIDLYGPDDAGPYDNPLERPGVTS